MSFEPSCSGFAPYNAGGPIVQHLHAGAHGGIYEFHCEKAMQDVSWEPTRMQGIRIDAETGTTTVEFVGEKDIR